MVQLKKNQLFASGIAILSGYLCFISFGYPSEASLFPRVLSVLLGSLGLLFFVRISRKSKAQKDDQIVGLVVTDDIDKIKSAGLVFGSIIAYGIVVKLVNYEIATMLFLGALIFLLGFKKKFLTILIACSLTIFLYFIFFKLLGVSRPESLFFQ